MRQITFLFTLLFSISNSSFAQIANPIFWVTNGEVKTIVNDNDTTYVGGNFDRVGPATGPFVRLTADSANIIDGFPRVGGGTANSTNILHQTIRVITPDGNGGWYIGGNFYSVNGIADTNIAHINADMSVDTAWRPHITGGDVWSISVHNNVVYVGGGFTKVSGITRTKMAAVDKITGLVKPFNKTFVPTTAACLVKTIVCSGNNIYIGGTFTQVDAVQRKGLAGINVTLPSDTGKLITSFDPGTVGGCANTQANTINCLLLSNNKLYIGGQFDTIGGCFNRRNIAAIDTSTGLATAWNPWSAGTAPATTVGIFCMALANGKIYAGGNFSIFSNILNTNYLVQIDTSGTGSATSISPVSGVGSAATIFVYTLAVLGNDLYVGGKFTGIGGQPMDYAGKIDLTTNFSSAIWKPNPNMSPVYAMAISGDTIVMGGAFSSARSIVRNRIFRFNANTGEVDPLWAPAVLTGNSSVYAIACRPNSVFIGGNFSYCNGTRRSIAEIPKIGDGMTNTGWPTQFSGSTAVVFSMVFTPNYDTLFIGGSFTTALTLYDNSFNYVAALNPDAASPYTWNQQVGNGPDGAVYTLAHKGNRLYVGGLFSNVNGVPRRRLVALNTDVAGGPAAVANWNPGATIVAVSSVFGLSLKADSGIYAGGSFTGLQGKSYLALIHTNDTGTVVSGFNPSVGGQVRSIAIENDTAVYFGGTFTSVAGQSAGRVAAVHHQTGALSQWFPNANFTTTTSCVINTISAGGSSIFIGGAMTTCNMEPMPFSYFAGFGNNCLGSFMTAGTDTSVCLGNTATLNACCANTYTWTPSASLDNASSANPIATPLSTTTYTVRGVSPLGCINYDYQMVTVNFPPASPTLSPGGTTFICPGDSIELCSSLQAEYNWSNGDSLQCIYASSAGDYFVTVSNLAGCSQNSDTISITMLSAPSIPTITDSSYWLKSISGNYLYQWYFAPLNSSSFNPIANGTDYKYKPLVSSGIFYVCITDPVTTCSSCSTPFIYDPASVRSGNAITDWGVYPNPFTDKSSVRFVTNTSQKISIDVVNILGSIVLTLTKDKAVTAGTPYDFPIYIKESGIYFVHIKMEDGTNTVKRIVRN